MRMPDFILITGDSQRYDKMLMSITAYKYQMYSETLNILQSTKKDQLGSI